MAPKKEICSHKKETITLECPFCSNELKEVKINTKIFNNQLEKFEIRCKNCGGVFYL